MNPTDVKYTRTHEWVRMDKASGIATAGITAYAVEQLGDIVYLELPESGAAVKRDSPFGVIESVKAAVDINSPVSGKVSESNKPLAEKFNLLVSDPYGQGWMIKVKASNPAEVDSLMSAGDYEKFLAEGGH